jgi:hypothetical protein
LTPGSGIGDGKKIQIRDENPGSYFRELSNISLGPKFLNSLLRFRISSLFDPGAGMEKFGSGINIPDPQHCSKMNLSVQEGYEFRTAALPSAADPDSYKFSGYAVCIKAYDPDPI